MNGHRLAGASLFCLLTAGASVALAAGPGAAPADEAAASDSAPLFRVFLKEGGSLVSYGELARLDDRVVFSMPTSPSAAAPQLQLINIPSSTVDWEKTVNYAETVRAARYLATRADADYALLTNDIAQALNDVGQTDDPKKRLAIVEKARKALAEWPGAHYNHKRDEIQQMLGSLDEAIANLRAAAGASTFDLTFVAASDAPPSTQPILPVPDVKESIEQTIVAARLTSSPAERLSLLTVAASSIDRNAQALPSAFVATARESVTAQIARETEIDRKYQDLSARMVKLATARAKLADVRGVQRVLDQVKTGDPGLGSLRPDAVAAILGEVEGQLDAARRLRLERDRWALRAPVLRAYSASVSLSLERLRSLTPLLEDIKTLAGSGPDAIGTILRRAEQIQTALGKLQPPDELRDVHALIASAAQLADNAAKIRREAAISGSIQRAWDASSAAAGALMLSARARTDIQAVLHPPQLPR